ncbi:hypothetical protein F5X96DRAFT_691657 [Biscogniauxia mediterranea]|nr:hypothetical protein F5X96DRAFT_691657 [Biscogniauxia mediterranea]
MAQKHVVCRRCSHLLRPAPQGTPFDQIEYLPHTQCPRCSLDDTFIDWEQKDLRQHEIEQSRRWLEAVAPGLSESEFAHHMIATPTLRTTEQMRRHRLYLESVENFSRLWSGLQGVYVKRKPVLATPYTRERISRGDHGLFEQDASNKISYILRKDEESERVRYEEHLRRGKIQPFESRYDWKAPMSRGPNYIAGVVHRGETELYNLQNQIGTWERLGPPSIFTSAENLPTLPVPGLGKRMLLDPDWNLAPPRTEPWPPVNTPAWASNTAPYALPGANRAINDYPDAAAAYAPNLLSGGSTNTSQQSGSNNPPLLASTNQYQDHEARVTSEAKRKPRSAIQHYFPRSAPGIPNPARHPPDAFTSAFTSPGNLDRNRITANPLAATSSAAPRVPASAPNIYNRPISRSGVHSTTRALARTASAALSLHGSGGLSRSVQPAARSLARTRSSTPMRPGSVQISGNYHRAVQSLGMTPIANLPATAPATAPPAAASPNNNNAQGGNTSGTSNFNVTRTTFGGAN